MSGSKVPGLFMKTNMTVDRTKFVKNLDTGAQDVLTSKNRHLPIIGENIAFTSEKMAGKGVGEWTLPLIPIRVQVWGGTEMTFEARTRLTLIGLSVFYLPVPEVQAEYNRYFAGYLTLLGTYVTPTKMIDMGVVAEAKARGFEVQFNTHTTVDALNSIIEQLECKQLMKNMGYTDVIDDNADNLQILGCCVFPLMAKRLLEVSLKKWFDARIKGFGQILGKPYFPDRTTPPELNTCLALNSFFGAHQALRAAVFKTFRSMSGGKSVTSTLFYQVCNLLKWSEMSHIWMISQFVFERYPEILCYAGLANSEIASFRVAVDLIATYPMEDIPFLKLLYPQSELTPLRASNHKMLTTAAHVIASQFSSSLANLNIGNAGDTQEFAAWVANYVTMKQEATTRVVARRGMTLSHEDDSQYMLDLISRNIQENPADGRVELRE